jgi:Uma2 family endonuclease
MSYEEFLAYGDDTTHAEWVNGEAIVFMPPTILHQLLAGFFYRLLASFVDRFRLGLVFYAPAQIRALPDGPAREPDVFFVSPDRLDHLGDRGILGPANLVVEVVSDTSVQRDRVDKFAEYQAIGIPEYLILDPRPGWQRVDFYALGPDGKYQAILPDDDGRYHSRALPGFWFRAVWFWQDPLPNPDELLPLLLAGRGA